jgi:hypothetical protein
MKVIDNPTVSAEKASASGRLDNVLGSLGLGHSGFQELQAQEELVANLEKYLDNRFVLLRNVTLEGLDFPIPMLLLGPPGVKLIYPCAARGVFRAKGDTLEFMDEDYKTFRTASPNLLTRAASMAEKVSAYLTANNPAPVEVEPFLYFSDPGTHVEAVRPSVRILPVDGLERFVAGILQSRVYFEKEEVQKLVDLLRKYMGVPERQMTPYSDRDAFSYADEERFGESSVLDRMPRGEGVVKALNKIPFSGRQWALLGCIVVINIAILIAFVVIVLMTS